MSRESQYYGSTFEDFLSKIVLFKNIVYRVRLAIFAQYRVHIAHIPKKDIAQAWSCRHITTHHHRGSKSVSVNLLSEVQLIPVFSVFTSSTLCGIIKTFISFELFVKIHKWDWSKLILFPFWNGNSLNYSSKFTARKGPQEIYWRPDRPPP